MGIRLWAIFFSVVSFGYLIPWGYGVLEPTTQYFGFSSMIVNGIVFMIILLSVVGGAGCFFLKNWARLILIATHILIFSVSVYATLTQGYLGYIREMNENPKGFVMATWIFLFGHGIALISPFVVLIFTQKKIKSLFENSSDRNISKSAGPEKLKS